MAAYQFQLADAKADLGIQAVAGSCPNTADFVNLINTVTRRLLKRGNFFETEWLVKLCTTGCRVVKPYFVGTVLGMRFCGKNDQTQMRNSWWSIIGPRSCNSPWTGDVVIRDGGTVPTYNEVSGTTGKLIRYVVVKANDYGKTITIYGKKYGAQPLQQLEDGAWRMGLDITSSNPFGTTTELVTKIDAVTREATEGMAYLYEYDAATDTLRDLAIYQPNETNPRYRSSIIENICAAPYCTDENGQQVRKVEALVKLQYFPVVNNWDFLLIDDLDALALGIQAIKLEQANDHQGAEIKWIQAIRELNYNDRNKQPDLQTAITCNVWGSGAEPLVNPI